VTRLVQKSKAKHFCLMNWLGKGQLTSTAGLEAGPTAWGVAAVRRRRCGQGVTVFYGPFARWLLI
jgi:hypothetical protein